MTRLPKSIPAEYQLWDADYIAEMLRLKVRYFREHVACAPMFPQAIRLPLAGGGMTKRYTIVPGAQLTLKTPRDYQIEAARREQDMNRAALALQAALDRMTRREVRCV